MTNIHLIGGKKKAAWANRSSRGLLVQYVIDRSIPHSP